MERRQRDKKPACRQVVKLINCQIVKLKMILNKRRVQLSIVFIALVVLSGIIIVVRNTSTLPDTENSTVQAGGEVISGTFDTSRFKTNSEWKKILSDEQYHILREAGTEIPYTGALDHETRKGTYYSVGCDVPLFRSEKKYDSGTGWPSFWAPISSDALVLRKESGFGDDRIEVLDTCGGHLGHVFDDGPEPTGKRYCMNSIALRFVPDKEQ